MPRPRACAGMLSPSSEDGQYLLRTMPGTATIVPQSRMISEPQDDELLVITVLPQYIGERYALLVRSLGYRTLDDLAAVRESRLSVLGGFGERRMAGIRQALADHGRAFHDGPKADLTPQIEAMTARLSERFGGSTEPSRSHPRIAPAAGSPGASRPGSGHGGGRTARRAAAH